MLRAFIWGFGWTLGKYAAILVISCVVMIFTVREIRAGALNIVIVLALAYAAWVARSNALEKSNAAYAICMKVKDPWPTNSDAGFWTQERWCGYASTHMSYQARLLTLRE